LIACLEKTILSEKMIEEDLSWVEESVTKSTYRLGIGFERCEKKDVNSAPKFVLSSNYHKEEESLKPTKTHYPSNPKPFFNQKRNVKRESPSRERKFCVHVLWPCWSLG
jgi:peptidyl-tRNA hydrolase